jgi:hypothetical protein
MKYLVTIVLLAAAFAAHADSYKPLVSADGKTKVLPLPGTARAYKNAKGIEQVDMLFQTTTTFPGTKQRWDRRQRMAFTGCAKGMGVAVEVDPDGMPEPGGFTQEWVRGGPTIADGIAVIACKAAPPLTITAPPLNSTAPSQNAAAVPLSDAAGLAASGGVPNLGAYDSETRRSMEVACVSEKMNGPVAYGACLNRQIESLKGSSGIPSLGAYDGETRRSMEIACVSEKMNGPVAYGACLDRQIASLRGSPGIPNLNSYDSETRRSMEIACVSDKMNGPVAYGACLNRHIASLRGSPGIPNLSSYDSETRRSMEIACVSDKMNGPVAYGVCLRRHIESLGGSPRSQ